MKMLGEQGVGHCQDSKKEQKDRSASGCESSTLITRGDYLAFLRPPAGDSHVSGLLQCSQHENSQQKDVQQDGD